MWRRAAASFCSLKTLPEWLSDFAEFICRVLFTNHWRIKTDDGQNWSLITFIIAGSDDKCDCWMTWITFMMNGLTLDVRWSWLNVECLRQRINTRPNNPVNLTAASDHQQSGAPRQWYGRGLINDVSSPLSFLATSVCQFVFKSSRFLDDSFHHFISFFISTLAEQWYHLLHNETETISDVDTWKRDALRRHFFSSAKQQQQKNEIKKLIHVSHCHWLAGRGKRSEMRSEWLSTRLTSEVFVTETTVPAPPPRLVLPSVQAARWDAPHQKNATALAVSLLIMKPWFDDSWNSWKCYE